ncbi:MAG: DUF1499 domain-containing protein [Myxococcota bacterium]
MMTMNRNWNGALSKAAMSGMLLTALLAAGCGGKMPEDLGAKGDRLGDCPESPNCVSSFATDEGHSIAAYALTGSAQGAWSGLGALLASRDDVEVVKNEGGYVHAVFTTPLMRYQDDVEFLLSAGANEIALRSASRVGYGDMDANRNRIEEIRAALAEQGLVAAASGN